MKRVINTTEIAIFRKNESNYDIREKIFKIWIWNKYLTTKFYKHHLIIKHGVV